MWSGPRNISTAMMYSFDNREDCHATDEPLYANFLLSTKTPHPDAQEVIENHETDAGVVIPYLTGPIPQNKPIWYQKHMCHHVMDDSLDQRPYELFSNSKPERCTPLPIEDYGLHRPKSNWIASTT